MHPAADPPPGIYLDDSAFAYDTVEALQRLGLRVVTPLDAGLLGAHDAAHTAYAAGAGLAILTKNPRDFPPGEHAGILAVYQDNDPGRDMSPADIARAVANVLAAGIPIVGQVIVLNHWRY